MRAYVLRIAAAVTSAGAHRERERRRKSPERGEYMKMYDTPQELSKYLNIKLECDCGRTHYVPIKGVEIGADAIERLPHYVKSLGYAHPLVLCDEITYKIAGARCMELMQTAGIAAAEHTLTHLGFDEATLGEIVINKPDDCDLIIGVGTGSITDMTRYSSFKLKLPCFTVATGAPMDGFAASIGIMNVNNLKATMPARCTEVIIGDTDILKTAPYRMTVAGFGDLIGKLTCLNDWELARIINGEHYCHNIVTLVRECVADVMKEAPKIKQRDPETLGSVMRGLVLSGAAISLYGDSRPASGAEHHMSHYWETILEQRGIRPAMHGEQVAVGTVLVLMLIEELLKENIDFDAAPTTVQRQTRSLPWSRKQAKTILKAVSRVSTACSAAGMRCAFSLRPCRRVPPCARFCGTSAVPAPRQTSAWTMNCLWTRSVTARRYAHATLSSRPCTTSGSPISSLRG